MNNQNNQTNTYTGSLGAVEKKISDLTSAVKAGYSGLPGITDALRKALYEREKTLPGLESDVESKIQELYTADKRLAERYANPESEMYIENPMNRQAIISGQKADIRGEYGNLLNLIQSRQNVIGNALNKGLELYKAGLAAQEFELQQAEKEWERIFKKQEAARKGSSTASKSAGMSELAKILLSGKTGWQPTEEKPTFNPSEDGRTNISWHSPLGQWQWSYEKNDWIPTGMEGTDRYKQDIVDLINQYPDIADEVLSNWSKINPPEPKKTQWQTKQELYQTLAKYKQEAEKKATTNEERLAIGEEISKQIQLAGFDPSDPYFYSLEY
jgi:hypothetical protein